MKKTLIAMAALAAAGTVAAQSSVTMYGKVNTGAQYFKQTETDGAGGKTTKKTISFKNNPAGGGTSRLGFKGSEALGNGLSATFQLEMGFCGATGKFGTVADGSTGFSREATVGLAGAFGSVRLGYAGTPMNNFDGSYKPVDATNAHDGHAVTLATDPSDPTKKYTQDADYTGRPTGIFYKGTFSNVTVEAALGQNSTSDKKGTDAAQKTTTSTYGLGLSYASGPLAVGAAVQLDNSKATGQSALWKDGKYIGNYDNSVTSYGVGASYDFTAAKLYTHYKGGKLKAKNHNVAPGVTGNGNYRYDQAAIGISVPFGATTLGAEYAYNKSKSTIDSKVENAKGNVFAVRAQYQLSKRSSLYARAAQQGHWKDKHSSASKKTQTFGVGLMHNF